MVDRNSLRVSKKYPFKHSSKVYEKVSANFAQKCPIPLVINVLARIKTRLSMVDHTSVFTGLTIESPSHDALFNIKI